MAAARQVQIEVTGKVDQYESALKQAETKTREMARNIGDASSIDGPTQRYTDFLGINSYERTKGQRRAAAAAVRRDAIEETRRINEAIAREARANHDLMAKIEETGRTPIGDNKGIGQYFKLGEGLGNLARGIISIEAVKGSLMGVSGVVSALHGDFESVEQTIRSLPLGLGGILGAMIDIGRAATNYKENLQASEEIAKSIEDRWKRLKEIDKDIDKSGKAAKEYRDSDAEGRAAETGGKIAGLEAKRKVEISKVMKEAEDMIDQVERNTSVGTYARNSRIALINAAVTGQIDAVNEKYNREIRTAQSQETLDTLQSRQKEIDAEKKEEEANRRRESQRRIAEFEYAGDKRRAQMEQIRAKYEEEIRNATSDKGRGLLRGAMNYELARVDGEENKKRMDERKEKAEAYFDKWASARDKAKSKLESNVDIIAGQRLEASDAGMLTRGTGTDRTQEIAAEQAKLQEETNKILSEMLQRERAKGAFVAQMVGFN